MADPRVTIVIPTRNRLASLREALSAVSAPADASVETIVVDDGSEDGTRAFLEEGEQAGRWRFLSSGGRGPAAARNTGLAAARAPIVAFTDDDCRAPAGWAAAWERLFSASTSDVAGAGGRVVTAGATGLPARLSQAITNGLVEGLNTDPQDAVFLTSNNVAYRAAELRTVGGFDESFTGAGGEDRDLHHRLRAAGKRLLYARELVVVHYPALGWRGFLRQQVRYGRGARRYYARGARRPLSLAEYSAAFVRAFAELPRRDRPALVLGAALSQGAVAWGYATAGFGRR